MNTSASKNRLNYGVGLGYQMSVAKQLSWQVSLNYLHTNQYKVRGSVIDTGTEMFNYHYMVSSNAVLLRNDLVFKSKDKQSIWHRLTPFVGFSLGYAANKSKDYSDEGYGSVQFASNTKGNFAWGVDGGVAYLFNANNSVSFTVQYLNLGSVSLGADETGHVLGGGKLKGMQLGFGYHCFF